MPPTDRTANKDYAIFLIRDNENNKIVDLTTDSNKRNYKFSILKSLKDGTEKKHPVNQLFKDSDADAIIFDVLDIFNGTHAQALDYMSKIAKKHNLNTTRTIDSDVLAIQAEIKKEKRVNANETTTEPTQEEDEEEEVKPTKPTKKTKPQKVLDTPPILEVIEITPTQEEKPKQKKQVKKIPISEPTQEEVEKLSEAIKTPISKKSKAPPKLSVDYEEDEEVEPAPTPIKPAKESKAKVAKKTNLINECEKLFLVYNDLTDDLFKTKQSILRKQEELKSDYKYVLDVFSS